MEEKEGCQDPVPSRVEGEADQAQAPCQPPPGEEREAGGKEGKEGKKGERTIGEGPNPQASRS